jgi:hypothetical protein
LTPAPPPFATPPDGRADRLRELLTRRRGDPAPAEPAAVLLVAGAGRPAGSTVRRAVADADRGTVAVLTLLRIHGSSWGFPNPGLLPNATAKAEAARVGETTIPAVERAGGRADGQITATRLPAKITTGVARRRRCRLVLLGRTPTGRVRSVVEGDLGASVRRRRRPAAVAVEVVERSTRTAADRPAGRSGRSR